MPHSRGRNTTSFLFKKKKKRVNFDSRDNSRRGKCPVRQWELFLIHKCDFECSWSNKLAHCFAYFFLKIFSGLKEERSLTQGMKDSSVSEQTEKMKFHPYQDMQR